MEEEEECNIKLGLGLGRSEFLPTTKDEYKHRVRFQLSLPPQMKEEIDNNDQVVHNFDRTSSRTTDDDEVENKNISTNAESNSISSNKTNRNASIRKKLVLTHEQVMFLEQSFRQHSVLTQTKKHNLADQLNLQPRQVEVWFQNRRARTKLKQKEMDCEFWKTYCESLRDENRRLKIELQDLRSSHYCVHLPLTLTPCYDKYEQRKERSKARREEAKPSKRYGEFDDS
ncbi:Homeobox-leucine zipper protein hox27 [Thalictrum thalictroides]|uniref:Homeobox-leucine zipper protein hox27 n=1 Tax=Thalictrum thalictroides TaxID=46969 RepID=A0A7J6VUL0_THATH|nr:Homeobox-leucine zipper protein hox27 [Thalictrum thalictroides]